MRPKPGLGHVVGQVPGSYWKVYLLVPQIGLLVIFFSFQQELR